MVLEGLESFYKGLPLNVKDRSVNNIQSMGKLILLFDNFLLFKVRYSLFPLVEVSRYRFTLYTNHPLNALPNNADGSFLH